LSDYLFIGAVFNYLLVFSDSVSRHVRRVYYVTITLFVVDTVIFVVIYYLVSVFTARCTLVQRAVLRSHIVCLSVRLCVRL